MEFSHIALRVKDIETMLNFYCKGLGFDEAFRIHNPDGSLRIVYIHITDGHYLELSLGGGYRIDFDDQQNLGFRHICFTVDHLEHTKKELEKKGIVFSSPIMKMKDENLAVYLFDPEKNKIELVQTDKKSPQFLFEQQPKKALKKKSPHDKSVGALGKHIANKNDSYLLG